MLIGTSETELAYKWD